MRKTTVPIATLVEDLALYPRHAVDEANVARLVQALKAGATLPPVIVDEKSKRIVDGWHRVRAYRRVLGDAAVVDAEFRKYPDEGSLFLDAVRLNAAHGRLLDRIDQVRIVTQARAMGLEDETVAVALNVTSDRVEKLSIRVAVVNEQQPGGIGGTCRVALKRPAQHLAGQQLTDAQAQAHQSAPGVSYLLLTQQLTEGLTSGLLNRADARLMIALKQLRDVLVNTEFAE